MNTQRVQTLMIVPVAKHPHHSLIPHWVTHLGALGLFSVAVLDSSVLPLPLPGSTDLLLLWLVSHRGEPWLLFATATIGSILGGYTCWSSGKRGGHAALQRYSQSPFWTRLSDWAKEHSFLSVFLPALLPPPVPLLPFLIAAGALGVSRQRFVLALSAARSVRYGLITWLAATYGRRVVRLWSSTLEKWSEPLLWAFTAILLTAICYGIWQFRKQRSQSPGVGLPLSPSVD
jgi:membrane protein YqaA with SNARE-associated domain